MATVYYATVVDCDTEAADVAHASASADTTTDLIGLRMGDGTNVPTQRQVLNALEIFERWIMQNGRDGIDADGVLPPNRG